MTVEQLAADDPQRIAEAFVSARKQARALPDYPGRPPETLAEGYRIQKSARALWGEAPVGWKVGRVPDPVVERFGANRLVGPIFRGAVHQADRGRPTPMPVFDGGFAAVEAEFLLVLGHAAPSGQTRFTMAEAAALVTRVHVGIEIASSPFPGINTGGPAVTVSDFGNNAGLIIGNEVEEGWEDAGPGSWPIRTLIDGQLVGESSANRMMDGPVGAVRFLLEWAADQGVELPAGTVVSTGAVTGVHSIAIGQQARCEFGDRFAVECTIRAA